MSEEKGPPTVPEYPDGSRGPWPEGVEVPLGYISGPDGAIVQTGEWPEGLRVQGWIRSKGCWMKDEGSGPSIKSMVIGKETKAYLVTFEHPGDPQGIGLMQKEVEADEVRYSVPGSRMVEFSLGGRVVYAANLDRVISISLVKEG